MIPAWNNVGWPPTVVAEWCKTGSSTQRRPTWNAEQRYEREKPPSGILRSRCSRTWRQRPARPWAWRRCSWAAGWATAREWAPFLAPASYCPLLLCSGRHSGAAAQPETQLSNITLVLQKRFGFFTVLTLWTNLDGGNVKILKEADGRGVSGRDTV